MAKNLVEMILGFLIIGGVTTVIAGVAVVLGRKEGAEVRLQQTAKVFQPMRRAS